MCNPDWMNGLDKSYARGMSPTNPVKLTKLYPSLAPPTLNWQERNCAKLSADIWKPPNDL